MVIPTDPTERAAWLQERMEYCEQATPGPWTASYDTDRSPSIWIDADTSLGITKTEVNMDDGDTVTQQDHDNNAFIASARTDLPLALAEIERLDNLVEELKMCLEPGKASAIVHGMFDLAKEQCGYRPTARHGLTYIEEELDRRGARIERLDARVRELEELAGKKEWRIGGLPPEFQGLPYRDAASARSDMALEAHHKRFTMWLECRTGPGPWVKAE